MRSLPVGVAEETEFSMRRLLVPRMPGREGKFGKGFFAEEGESAAGFYGARERRRREAVRGGGRNWKADGDFRR